MNQPAQPTVARTNASNKAYREALQNLVEAAEGNAGAATVPAHSASNDQLLKRVLSSRGVAWSSFDSQEALLAKLITYVTPIAFPDED